jgi:hypothetical protein
MIHPWHHLRHSLDKPNIPPYVLQNLRVARRVAVRSLWFDVAFTCYTIDRNCVHRRFL